MGVYIHERSQGVHHRASVGVPGNDTAVDDDRTGLGQPSPFEDADVQQCGSGSGGPDVLWTGHPVFSCAGERCRGAM